MNFLFIFLQAIQYSGPIEPILVFFENLSLGDNLSPIRPTYNKFLKLNLLYRNKLIFIELYVVGGYWAYFWTIRDFEIRSAHLKFFEKI